MRPLDRRLNSPCRPCRGAIGRAPSVERSGHQPGGFAQGPDEKYGRAGGVGLAGAGCAGGDVSLILTLLTESTRRVGTAWPEGGSKRMRPRKTARKIRLANFRTKCCSAQQIEFAQS